MTKVKICGLTNQTDAIDAIELGADALGFIFIKESPRYISPNIVQEISQHVPPFVQLVGVFMDQEKAEIDEIINRCRIDLIQLHGNESPEFCTTMKRRVLKAFHIAEIGDMDAIPAYKGHISAALLDTKVGNARGGTGQSFDWGIALQAQQFNIPLILAGGINTSNIKKAIQLVNPYAIDVSSGVEASPGKKDYNKLQAFIEAAKL
jgi:phosphoribosylanthranilate isomerase